MRVDLHVHTCASPDSLTRPERVLWWAQRRGLGAVAITDHDTIEAARSTASQKDVRVIVGEEVYSSEGEVIGLFLHETIPPGSSAADTIRFIHEQGGLAVVPHPFDALRGSTIHRNVLEEIAPSVDMVEVFNARVLKEDINTQAQDWAMRYGKPCSAGSDAHLGCEIGRAYIEIPCFSDRDSFCAAINQSVPGGRRSSALVHLGSGLARFAKQVTGFQTW